MSGNVFCQKMGDMLFYRLHPIRYPGIRTAAAVGKRPAGSTPGFSTTSITSALSTLHRPIRLIGFRPDFMDRVAAEQGLVCKHLDWPHPHSQSWVVFATSSGASAVPDLTGICKYINYAGIEALNATELAGSI